MKVLAVKRWFGTLAARQLIGRNRHPVADGIRPFHVGRDAGNDVLDIGLQRHADAGRDRDAAGRDPAQGKALLPPQCEGDSDRDKKDRDDVLNELGRFAIAPLLEMAFPVEMPNQPVDHECDGDDQRRRQQALDTALVPRRIVADERTTEQARQEKEKRDEERPEHHFSVILNSTPSWPCARRSACHLIQESPGASAASAANIALASGASAAVLAKAAR